MSVGRIARALVGGPVKRPEIDAMLDAELDRHAQVMRDLLQYAYEQEANETERPSGEIRGPGEAKDVAPSPTID